MHIFAHIHNYTMKFVHVQNIVFAIKMMGTWILHDSRNWAWLEHAIQLWVSHKYLEISHITTLSASSANATFIVPHEADTADTQFNKE